MCNCFPSRTYVPKDSVSASPGPLSVNFSLKNSTTITFSTSSSLRVFKPLKAYQQRAVCDFACATVCLHVHMFERQRVCFPGSTLVRFPPRNSMTVTFSFISPVHFYRVFEGLAANSRGEEGGFCVCNCLLSCTQQYTNTYQHSVPIPLHQSIIACRLLGIFLATSKRLLFLNVVPTQGE